MKHWSRKQLETFLLAVLGLLSVVPFRLPTEDRVFCLAELAAIAIVCMVATGKHTFKQMIATAALPMVPILFAIVVRYYATPIATELTALTAFGTASIAMAVGGRTSRVWALSLVTSGFLVLFCAAISDSGNAFIVPLIWMLGCVWHLVANHWERLDLAMPDSVSRTWRFAPGDAGCRVDGIACRRLFRLGPLHSVAASTGGVHADKWWFELVGRGRPRRFGNW